MKVVSTLITAKRPEWDVNLFETCVSAKVNLLWIKKVFPIFIIIGKHRRVVCPTALKLSASHSAHPITVCKQKLNKREVDRCYIGQMNYYFRSPYVCADKKAFISVCSKTV